MSDSHAPDVRETAASDERDEDVRAQRSLAALRAALAELLQEQDFRDITVQQIVVRAGVARATFYAHYRNKDDALAASFEGMLASFAARLDDPPVRSVRLVPLAEMLEHFAAAGPIFSSLHNSGRLDGVWSLGTDLLADLIARRLPRFVAPHTLVDVDTRLLARMLAGACLELTRWWLDRADRATPASLDAQFHAMARRLVAGR